MSDSGAAPTVGQAVDLTAYFPFRAYGTFVVSSPWFTLLAAKRQAAEQNQETP